MKQITQQSYRQNFSVGFILALQENSIPRLLYKNHLILYPLPLSLSFIPPLFVLLPHYYNLRESFS